MDIETFVVLSYEFLMGACTGYFLLCMLVGVLLIITSYIIFKRYDDFQENRDKFIIAFLVVGLALVAIPIMIFLLDRFAPFIYYQLQKFF